MIVSLILVLFQEIGLINNKLYNLNYYLEIGNNNFRHKTRKDSNCIWIAARFGLPFNDYGSDCYNQIYYTGCHGFVIGEGIEDKDAVISSLYNSYNQPKLTTEDLDQYYSEVMPYFNAYLLKDFELGDKVIAVNPNCAGNMAMMALIISRQPWECLNFLSVYIKARKEGYNPLMAVYLGQYTKYHPIMRGDLSSDHDVFNNYIDLNRLYKFIVTGKPHIKNLKSFNQKSKEGVFSAFKARVSAPSYHLNTLGFRDKYKIIKTSSFNNTHFMSEAGVDPELQFNHLNEEAERVMTNLNDKVYETLRGKPKCAV